MRPLTLITLELASQKPFQIFVLVQNIQLYKHQCLEEKCNIFYIKIIIRLSLGAVEVLKSKTKREYTYQDRKKTIFSVNTKEFEFTKLTKKNKFSLAKLMMHLYLAYYVSSINFNSKNCLCIFQIPCNCILQMQNISKMNNQLIVEATFSYCRHHIVIA